MTDTTTSKITSGPVCRDCTRTEQRCAYLGPCCAGCTHWLRYDSDGNPGLGRPGRPRLRTVPAYDPQPPTTYHRTGVRPPLLPCGTHAAFNRHRVAGTEPCGDCWDAERCYQRTRPRAARHLKAVAS